MSVFSRKLLSLNRIEVSKRAIWGNWEYFQNKFDGEVWPVVKANAYGHGLKEVAGVLKDKKLTYLVADSYYEALTVWRVSPNQQVLLIGSNHLANLKWFDFRKVTLMVQDRETLEVLGGLGKHIRVHLKVDTGMRRQGVKMVDLRSLMVEINKYKNIEFEGVMSHLADADNEDDSFTQKQIERFEEVKKMVLGSGLRPKYWHLAASAGMDKMPKGLTNVARLGLGLYLGQKPALRMVSTLTKVGELAMGDRVSYGGTFVAPHKMRFGVIPVGYHEGLPRRMSNKWRVLGRVCMNLTVIGVDDRAKLGDEVEVISNKRQSENSVENIAKLCETIPYEILVGLDGSVRRVVI